MVDISKFISAVRPKERTDQYVILAAMFVLNAHTSTVTAKEISKLLRLHLGTKVPSNVPASLRAYIAYASPTDKGPPIRWSLTEKGIDHLRSLSGLDLSPTPGASNFKSDVGIVCALESPELAAVLAAFGGKEAWKVVGDTRHTHIGVVPWSETRS